MFLCKNATLIARLNDVFGNQKKEKHQWMSSDKNRQVGNRTSCQRLQKVNLEIDVTL